MRVATVGGRGSVCQPVPPVFRPAVTETTGAIFNHSCWEVCTFRGRNGVSQWRSKTKPYVHRRREKNCRRTLQRYVPHQGEEIHPRFRYLTSLHVIYYTWYGRFLVAADPSEKSSFAATTSATIAGVSLAPPSTSTEHRGSTRRLAPLWRVLSRLRNCCKFAVPPFPMRLESWDGAGCGL